MVTVIGVKFRHQVKCYYFDPRGEVLRRGDSVIVETAQGVEMATVVTPNTEIEEDQVVGELRPIVRIADEDDFDQLKLNRKNEQDAVRICKQKIADRGLQMKLIRSEYAFDRTKLTFYFTADGRVDFRELVKDLASIFRTRIELRQVGVRDETKLLGGIGICGRELCCATWLTDFVPVSIKMAKEQNLSLNSAKISGICGRLMCCLKNEEDTYEYLNSQLPSVNARVRTPEGHIGVVTAVDVLRQRVSVVLSGDSDDDKEVREYAAEELRFTPRRRDKKGAEAEEPAEPEAAESEEKAADRPEKQKKGGRPQNGHENRNENRGENRNTDNRERRNRGPWQERRNDRKNRPERRKDQNNDASGT